MFQIFFTVVSVLLIVVILLQQKSSSLGSMMGGDDSGEEMVQTRRGADKFLFRATLALAILFAGAGIYAMVF